MNRFLDALRLARKDFFKLRRHREAPGWAMWTMAALVALQFGLGLLLVAALLGGQWLSPAWWWHEAPPFLATTLIIGAVFHAVFTAIERLASDRFLAWANGKPSVLVSLFFALTSIACVAAGLTLAWLILGSLPGMQRIDWTPQRSWLSVAGACIFGSVLWGLWAWQQWHEEQLKRQAQEAQLRLLQAQIEPHFLFNTLAHVQALMDCDPPGAKRMLEAFGDYLRASLSEMRCEQATVASEFRLLEQYLGLMQLRMEDRLSFRFELDPAAAALPLPPMLLQPLVENAIHHGIEPCCDRAEIVIGARVDGGQLRLEVRDSGQGLEAAKRRPRASRGNGVALANIRERLAAQFDDRAGFLLEDAPPRGTRALITLPLPT
jgi:signal transduction histidine kinase